MTVIAMHVLCNCVISTGLVVVNFIGIWRFRWVDPSNGRSCKRWIVDWFLITVLSVVLLNNCVVLFNFCCCQKEKFFCLLCCFQWYMSSEFGSDCWLFHFLTLCELWGFVDSVDLEFLPSRPYEAQMNKLLMFLFSVGVGCDLPADK